MIFPPMVPEKITLAFFESYPFKKIIYFGKAIIKAVFHKENTFYYINWKNYRLLNSASMAAAAFLPAPIARITVAAPVTASPPA